MIILSPMVELSAGSTSGTWADGYQLLAPLPNPDGGKPLETFDPTQPNNLSAYLNLMIKIFIGLCAVLAVVMIVVGGLEYMTSELVSSKEAGKGRIRNALIGLIIALGAYALLFTINPDLLNLGSAINPPAQNITVELPPTWYFEFQSSTTGENFISGPSDQAECENKMANVTRSAKIVRPCFSSATPPATTTPRGDCVVRRDGGTLDTSVGVTKIDCEAALSSQSWNGMPTPNAVGVCTFKNRETAIIKTSYNTTKKNCQYNPGYISWQPKYP